MDEVAVKLVDAHAASQIFYDEKLKETAYNKSPLGYGTTAVVSLLVAGILGGGITSKIGAAIGGAARGAAGAISGSNAGWLVGGIASIYSLSTRYIFYPTLELWAYDPKLEQRRKEWQTDRFQHIAITYFNAPSEPTVQIGQEILGKLNISDQADPTEVQNAVNGLFHAAMGSVNYEFRTEPVRRRSVDHFEYCYDKTELKTFQHQSGYVCPTSSEEFDGAALSDDLMGSAIMHYCYVYFAHSHLKNAKVRKNSDLVKSIIKFKEDHFSLFSDFAHREIEYRESKIKAINGSATDAIVARERLQSAILNALLKLDLALI
jgi:hypothetical protein